MMKKLLSLVSGLLLVACGGQNNIQFSSQMGQCRDGVNGAPYCMAMTIQNNAGGQNWINNTNFPISNLSLSIGGMGNINYPVTQGSLYDPNNCLGSTISPGGQCTFYLQINSESAAVGSHIPVVLTANFTVNDSLFGGISGSGNSSGSASTTIYETPALMLSSSQGMLESYSAFGLGLPYHGESSEFQANVAANDNYYGFLYLGGNNGIYFSNESGYIGNATNGSSTIQGAGNLIVYGTTFYATPNNLTSLPSVYTAGLLQESFGWSSYATGVNPSTKANVSTNNGNITYFSSNSIVQICNPTSAGGSNCSQEGIALNYTINALAFSQLGTSVGGIPLTGVMVGTESGLFAESGNFSSPANGWIQFVDSADGTPISGKIVKMVADNNFNIYIADGDSGWIYIARNGGGNTAYRMVNLGPVAPNIVTMAVDLTGQDLYVGTAGGDVYGCTILGGACTQIIQGSKTGLTTSGALLLNLNIITSLTSY